MRFRAAVSRILYPASGTAIICLCDQNPEFITPRATAHSLFGLAAGRVCHAMRLSPAPGGLLPRHFTLTTFPEKRGGIFLLRYPFRGISSTASFFSKGFPALCSPDFPPMNTIAPEIENNSHSTATARGPKPQEK